MSLHVKRYEYAGTGGSGAPLLLIHGWGMHGGMWDGVAEQLAQNFNVYAVDLPGHGYSRGQRADVGWVERSDTHHVPNVEGDGYRCAQPILRDIVDALSVQFDEPLTVCGWSMGGQIALHWAMREPEKIKRLVLVTSTPCFAERDDWQFGMPQHTLLQFAADLEKNHAATLRRFLGLQVRGSEGERELLATLCESLFSHGEPDLGALRGGLDILRDCDLRSALPDIKQPVLVVAGEKDMITPPQASQYLAGRLPDARLVTIRGAAHVPFLSHTEEFTEHVKNFFNE